MIVKIGHVLMGDTILVEPAISAWSIANSVRARLELHPAIRQYECLFDHHQYIDIVRDVSGDEDEIKPDTSAAFSFASGNGLPFAAGYFPQFGLTPDASRDRLHYKAFGLPERKARKYVCLCPHARSCDSARDPRYSPNIRASAEFWSKVVDYIWGCRRVPVDLGSKDDVPIPRTISQHGHGLRFVCENWLLNAAAVVSVETGLLHLVGGLPGVPTIFLSAATPVSFAAPPDSTVVRGKTQGRPDFDADEVIGHLDRILRGN